MMLNKIQSVYLILNGVLFLGLGVAYLGWPAKLAGKTDMVLTTDTATIEIRAIYGGMEVALGLLLVVCALRHNWAFPALILTIVLYAGFAGGRIYGIIAASNPGVFTWKLLAFEVTALAAGCVLAVLKTLGSKG